jgi:hypothetical protein
MENKYNITEQSVGSDLRKGDLRVFFKNFMVDQIYETGGF